MKKSLFAITVAVSASVIAAPSPAITFPSLTTIYVGSGVFDDGGATDVGTATSIHCSNVSGATVQVRVLILSNLGVFEGAATRNVVHGQTMTFSTHVTLSFSVNSTLSTGAVAQGVVNVESTDSAVFCTAMIVDAAIEGVDGVPLHMVRVNPHPGTVE